MMKRVGLLLLLAACAQEHEFTESTRTRADPPPPAKDENAVAKEPVKVEGAAAAEPVNTTTTISDREVYINDVFELAPIKTVRETFANPDTNFTEQTCEQVVKPKTDVPVTVVGRGEQQKPFDRKSPLRHITTLKEPDLDKAIDIFVTIDDSETKTPILVERTKKAVQTLVKNLANYNWKLYLGGLKNTAGGVGYDSTIIPRIVPNSPTDASNYDVPLDIAVGNIFDSASNGDERVFYSLNKLVSDNRGLVRANSTLVFLTISDAANCRTFAGGTSSDCNLTAGQMDFETYLLDNNTVVEAPLKHKAIYGAYYRKTQPSATICSASDSIEPVSQYGRLAAAWEAKIKNEAVGPQTYTGDLCSVDEDTAWLGQFTFMIKDLADRRLALAAAPDDFPGTRGNPGDVHPDMQYDLQVNNGAGELATGTYWYADPTTRRVLVLADVPTTDVTATYHKANGYNQLSYAVLSPTPEPGNIKLKWTEGATAREISCQQSSSAFNAEGCRYWGNTVYIEDRPAAPVLPKPAPPSGGGETLLTVKAVYFNEVTPVYSMGVTADAPLVPGSIAFKTWPTDAAGDVAAAVFTIPATNKNQVAITLPGGAAFRPGNYVFSYHSDKHYATECAPTSPVATGSGALACYLPDGDGALDVNGNVVVTPAAMAYPCTYDRAANKVRFGGDVPLNAATGKRQVIFGYHSVPADRKSVTLEHAPNDKPVAATLGMIGAADSHNPLDPAKDFKVAGNVLTMTDAVHPGQELKVVYEVEPPLNECFRLTSTVAKGYNYEIKYGDLKKSVTLAPEQFKIEAKAGELPVICLVKELVVNGRQLMVTYLSEKVYQEN